MGIDNTDVTREENEKKNVVGFKVTSYEHYILNQYAEIFYNQEILDLNIKQQKKLLELPGVSFLI